MATFLIPSLITVEKSVEKTLVTSGQVRGPGWERVTRNPHLNQVVGLREKQFSPRKEVALPERRKGLKESKQ